MNKIHAIYENGVFRPRESVALPEGSEVEFEPRLVQPVERDNGSLASVYEILGRRFDSGESDVSARHNEHQP